MFQNNSSSWGSYEKDQNITSQNSVFPLLFISLYTKSDPVVLLSKILASQTPLPALGTSLLLFTSFLILQLKAQNTQTPHWRGDGKTTEPSSVFQTRARAKPGNLHFFSITVPVTLSPNRQDNFWTKWPYQPDYSGQSWSKYSVPIQSYNGIPLENCPSFELRKIWSPYLWPTLPLSNLSISWLY